MYQEILKKIINKEALSFDDSYVCMDLMMSEDVSEIKKTTLLSALMVKGVCSEEVAGFASSMRDHANTFQKGGAEVLEIVGTGGDMANTFNISTVSAIVCAGAGIKVAKHGNRAASSKCGTADCLEALGVKIDLPAQISEKILEEIGICFLFAQNYHPSMKYIAPVRREIGMPTVFNVLGPLTNPSKPDYQLLGVYDKNLMRPMSEALMKLGVSRGVCVHGGDGLDEASLCGSSFILEFCEGGIREYEIYPEDFGLKRCLPEDLRGGSPKENADIVHEILDGKESPKLDAVLLNSGIALYAAGKSETILDGVKKAGECIMNGLAKAKLQDFITLSNAYI